MLNLLYDKALKLKRFLIISDLHAGIEELLLESGSNFPKVINSEMVKRLLKIQEFSKTNKLIINGDIKHEFSKNIRELLNLKEFFSNLKEYWDEIILVKGNHDLFIENIVKPLSINVFRRINIKNKIVITHGDKLYEDFFDKNKIFIIGNEHPALKIRELNFEEHVFLANRKLIVLPAFNNFLKGSNILNKDFLSPYFNYVKGQKFFIFFSKISSDKVERKKLGSIIL